MQILQWHSLHEEIRLLWFTMLQSCYLYQLWRVQWPVVRPQIDQNSTETGHFNLWPVGPRQSWPLTASAFYKNTLLFPFSLALSPSLKLLLGISSRITGIGKGDELSCLYINFLIFRWLPENGEMSVVLRSGIPDQISACFNLYIEFNRLLTFFLTIFIFFYYILSDPRYSKLVPFLDFRTSYGSDMIESFYGE